MSFIATLCYFIYEKGINFFAPGASISRHWGVLIIDYNIFYFIWKYYFWFTLVGLIHCQNQIDSSGCLLGYRNMHQKLSVIYQVQISRYYNISCYTKMINSVNICAKLVLLLNLIQIRTSATIKLFLKILIFSWEHFKCWYFPYSEPPWEAPYTLWNGLRCWIITYELLNLIFEKFLKNLVG